MRERDSFAACFPLVVTVLLSCFEMARADMVGGKRVVIDLGNPDQAKQRTNGDGAEKSEGRDKAIASRSGTTLEGVPWVETTEPVPIGWSWRPVVSTRVTAKVAPPGRFRFSDNSATYPSGQFYVRYTSDGKHWSSWQNLEIQDPKDRIRPEQVYRGEVRIPYGEREAYDRLLQEYSKKDVPWRSDEEAAVKWILQTDPRFFEKSLPFVGYVQFRVESPPLGAKRVEIQLDYGAGGVHAPPSDETIFAKRQGPWRLKAE